MERRKLILCRHLFRLGTIETPINEDDLQGPKRKMMEERIPLGRFGRPEDIAEPVCFMASDMAKYSRPNWAPRSIAVHQLIRPISSTQSPVLPCSLMVVRLSACNDILSDIA